MKNDTLTERNTRNVKKNPRGGINAVDEECKPKWTNNVREKTHNQIAFLEIASLEGAAKKTMKLADSNGDSCSKSSLF